MKKHRLIFLLIPSLLIVSLTGSAETVSQKQAKELAQKFFDHAYHESTAPVNLVYNGKRLTTDRLFTPFYVYNQPRGGFVIIAAENKAFPILGYSLKSNFNPDALSEYEQAWLRSFARDIELIRYQPEVPEEAIFAWQNYPEYVVGILDSIYDATDPAFTVKDIYPELNELLYTSDNSRDGDFSAVYTPAQWSDMISEHLSRSGSVALGFVDDNKELYPAVVHGRKGDYYRLMFENSNDWLLRLSATEFLGDRQITLISDPVYVAGPEPEEVPFEFFDSYITEHTENTKLSEESLTFIPSEPIVKGAAAGHFDVILPENSLLAMIYNLQGSYIGRATYKGQNVAHINIEAEPSGFYFAIIYGESGRPYGIKLYR